MGNSLWSTVRDLGARAGLCAFVHLAAFGRREDRQLRHRKMLLVVRYQHQLVCQRHGGDGDIGVRKGVPLLPPFAEQLASELGNLTGHGVEFERIS